MRMNSFDEWTRLREVILGCPDGYAEHVHNLHFDTFVFDKATGMLGYYPNISAPGTPATRVAAHQRFVEELVEDVEGMAAVLDSLSVKVYRPQWPKQAPGKVTTLGWTAPITPPLNVRDTTLIAGDEIIETSPTHRSRYYENFFLKPVFTDYFKGGSRWTVMPMPLMTDFSCGDPSAEATSYDVRPEMMIDAANCLRLGVDMLVNIAHPNHALACDWLERHLAGRFRIHRIRSLTRGHLDSTVLALRPGVLLLRSARVLKYLPEQLLKWKPLIPPESSGDDFPQYDDGYPIPPSPYLDLNVLSVDEETVLVNQACPKLIRMLEDNHFTVIPIQHRHRRLFGGGLHCFTLDTVRDGGPEDYLT